MKKEQIIKNIQDHFDQDVRIHSVYLSGSHRKNASNFSDIDIRIVCMEEADLLSLINTLPEELKSIFSKDIVYYTTTPYHFFFLLPWHKQLDINIVSAAQYFSIKSNDQQPLINNFTPSPNFNKKEEKDWIYNKLLEWYATLHRCMSKYIKEDYMVAVRFIQSIRENYIFWLIWCIQDWFRVENKVDIDTILLESDIGELIMDLYPKPKKQEIKKALFVIDRLFVSIAEKNWLHSKIKSRSIKIQKSI